MKKLFIILLLGLYSITQSQPLKVSHHFENLNYSLSSFKKDISNKKDFEVYHTEISKTNAPYLRLYLSDCELGSKSYLRITSLYDGISQKIDAGKLKAWKNTSIFFNGDKLLVEFYKNKYDKNIKINLEKLLVGERLVDQSIDGTESICGTEDDRVSSDNKAVGRIVPVGCTAWITPSGKLVSAGHCVFYSTDFSDEIIEFNVPMSLSDGYNTTPWRRRSVPCR